MQIVRANPLRLARACGPVSANAPRSALAPCDRLQHGPQPGPPGGHHRAQLHPLLPARAPQKSPPLLVLHAIEGKGIRQPNRQLRRRAKVAATALWSRWSKENVRRSSSRS